MIDLAAASAAVGGLRTAFELSKAIVDGVGTVKSQGKVIELQGAILAAQSSAMIAQQVQSQLLDRVGELEAEVARLKQWGVEREDYRLEDVHAGAFVYSPRKEPSEAEPNFWLCVNCFESGRPSKLQNQGRTKEGALSLFECPTCNKGFALPFRIGPHQRIVEANVQVREPPAPTPPSGVRVIMGRIGGPPKDGQTT